MTTASQALVEHDEHQIEHVPVRSEVATPMAMIDRALMSGAAPETLEKLLALQERCDGQEEAGGYGYGETEAEAIQDLLEIEGRFDPEPRKETGQ